MKITVKKIKAKNLKPGDLFSRAGKLYWDNYSNNKSIGEKVYIRTSEECPKDQEEVEIYKLTINQS